ncbi:hypothetical protein EVAR_31466_1 [Eumeta japonica]|uniref:CHK kinase-like domain-containing protein n=1 Tax=Eumeta variegata TaxID=151549 RepID=A0A4C1W960_EUMVA|nr:hypothetical protein EVAR_31466_1 [Eumeta japonica]
MSGVLDAALLATIVTLFTESGKLHNVTARDQRITAEGDGYVSVISRVVVEGRDATGAERTYDTVVKAPLPNIDVRKNVPLTLMFERETLFFDRIIPKFNEVQERLAEEEKLYFPLKYFSSGEYLKEYIVMENLKSSGYKNANSDKQLDFAHGSVVVSTLAKFHALSFIYKTRFPSDYSEVTKQLTDNFMLSRRDYDASGVRKYGKRVFDKFINSLRNAEYKDKIVKAADNDYNTVLQDFWGNGTINVISHGDYWINNILFKYNKDVPTGAVIIDYQMARHSSLVNDLLSFLGTCFELELRRNHFWELIDVYYKSLDRFLNIAGYDINDFCTRDEFDKELRAQSFFGVAVGIFMISFFDTEVPEIQLLFGGDLPDSFDRPSPKFEMLANDLIEDYVSWGLL